MGSQFEVVENSANIVDAFLAGVFLTIMLGKKRNCRYGEIWESDLCYA